MDITPKHDNSISAFDGLPIDPELEAGLKVIYERTALRDVAPVTRRPKMDAAKLRACLDVSSLDSVPGAEALLLPPSCNTGVDTNYGPGQGLKQCLIDYLRFTVTQPEHLEYYLHLISGDVTYWHEKEGGLYRYTHSHFWGSASVFSKGVQEGMGFCVQLSGQACRELEHRMVKDMKIGPVRCSNWPTLLYCLLDGHCPGSVSITRLDVALDDFTGVVTMEDIKQAALDDLFSCRGGVQIDDGTVKELASAVEEKELPVRITTSRPRGSRSWGTTVNFGRKSSTSMMRFYDKKSERANAGVEVVGDWLRAEYEAHDERAMNLAAAIVKFGLACIPGVIRGYIDFKAPHNYDRKNRYKAQSAAWWTAFLDEWDKLLLTLRPLEHTIEKARRWIRRQVATSLAMVTDTSIRGCIPELLQIVQDGRDSYKSRHRHMIAQEIRRLSPTG